MNIDSAINMIINIDNAIYIEFFNRKSIFLFLIYNIWNWYFEQS